ncbi:MAG: XRE family transcriptional regulator [Kocuria sp.]|nr:XRE family transcriptional regulator [Kocuria sp.]
MTVPLQDAPRVLRAAREDAGLTQRALADAVGARQPHIAGIESGRRPVSEDLLERLLEATDYRPSLALAARRDELVAFGGRRGIRNIRVFGSVTRGSDHHTSDIDLLVELDHGADPLGFAVFVAEATELLGFPVDAVIDDQHVHPHIRQSAVSL